MNVLRDVWTDHLSSIRAAAADLFTVLNKTYYTYYTTHISKIHKTQFHTPVTPYPLFQWYLQSKDIWLNLSMKCCNSVCCNTKFETDYSSCTVRMSENLCSSNGGAQEKGKTGWNLVYHQNWWEKSFIPPWMLMYFFAGFFWVSPCVWANSGFWCCAFLPLWITLIF